MEFMKIKKILINAQAGKETIISPPIKEFEEINFSTEELDNFEGAFIKKVSLKNLRGISKVFIKSRRLPDGKFVATGGWLKAYY